MKLTIPNGVRTGINQKVKPFSYGTKKNLQYGAAYTAFS